jgi:hypothetical protein
MALVPKCPFRVNLYSRLGDHLRIEHHNYETLRGAMSYRDVLLTRPRTTRVEVLMVLDESTPTQVTSVTGESRLIT